MSEEAEVHGYADSDLQIDFLHITTSSPSAARPIVIPTTPACRRDPDRVSTPVSGRGDRKGHLFPVQGLSPTRLSHYPNSQEDIPQSQPSPLFDHTYHHRSLSLTLSPRSAPIAMLHADRASSHYTPTSPLSPRFPGATQPVSPQPPRTRQPAFRSVKIPISIPKFDPSRCQQMDLPATSSASSHNPVINYTKHSSTTESTRLMKERQRELIDKAKMSSRLAASPHGVKPDAPRLDPLGSPKGPVTPLALEEGCDYFLIASSGGTSPAVSPTSRNEGFARNVEDGARLKKAPSKKMVAPDDGQIFQIHMT